MHFHFLNRNFLAVSSEVTNGFIRRFCYDGSFSHLWTMWRRNNVGSFILPGNLSMFRGQIQLNGRSVRFSPSRSHHIYLIYAFSSWSSIPVNYMIMTFKLTIFLDLDLFYSLDDDTELIEINNDISDVSWLQQRYGNNGVEFMGYQVSWWSSRLWGSHIIQFSLTFDWTIFLISLVLKWPWRNTVNRCLIPPLFFINSLLQIQLVMILHNVQPSGWIISSKWVNSRKILKCIMWYVFFA